MGTWSERQDEIMGAFAALPAWPWSLGAVVDERGRDTGFALLRGRIQPSDRAIFDEVAASHRIIGVMQWWGFPRADLSWAGEHYERLPDDPLTSYQLPEIDRCVAWAYCARDATRYLPPDKPAFMFSNSDFVDLDAVWTSAYGPDPDSSIAKRWDVICAYSGHWYNEIQKNWALGRRIVETLAGDLGLSVLLIGRAGVPDVPDLPNVEVRHQISWDECMGCLARSRIAVFPNHLDPSPRFITEAIAADVPVLVNSLILGGWKYVVTETGRIFEGETDLVAQTIDVLSSDFRPRAWLARHYGRDRAAGDFAARLRHLGGADDLQYALPSFVLH